MKSIILAGGSGSRLWPLSRDEYPKQLLSFDGKESLLQKTFNRLLKFSLSTEILTITNIKHYSDIKLQLDSIENKNTVLAEPVGKNTAPAIAAAIEYFIKTDNKDDIVLIVPSDHLIKDVEGFAKTVEKGIQIAEQGYIVTFGIRPNYPETGYGYIKTKNKLLNGYKVDKFVEKPDIKTAEQYLKSGEYYWNGGIFLGKISTFIEEFQKYAHEIYENIQSDSFFEDYTINSAVYEKMPSISIDYAIMEKSDKVALVELESDWNDLGSWQSIYDVKEKDKNGNVLTGNVIVNNVKNSYIYSQKETVAVSGLENIILVETEDAIMACKLNESQDVKNLYGKLKLTESKITKLHKTIYKPWGSYTVITSGDGYLTRTICLEPHKKIQEQNNKKISKHWVILEGKAVVVKNEKEYNLSAGESIDIPFECKHTLKNDNNEELKIIEIQKS